MLMMSVASICPPPLASLNQGAWVKATEEATLFHPFKNLDLKIIIIIIIFFDSMLDGYQID